MNLMTRVCLWLAWLPWGVDVARGLPRGEAGSERGDVPGWVMITLMSAVLVMGLLAVAAPALEGLFQQAISKVSK
jgi:hypothetical protein